MYIGSSLGVYIVKPVTTTLHFSDCPYMIIFTICHRFHCLFFYGVALQQFQRYGDFSLGLSFHCSYCVLLETSSNHEDLTSDFTPNNHVHTQIKNGIITHATITKIAECVHVTMAL